MKKIIKYIPLYRTRDQWISATLFALNKKLDSSEWLNDECWFVFENKEKCEAIVKKYFAGELRVDPRNLFNALKDIKSIIFSN